MFHGAEAGLRATHTGNFDDITRLVRRDAAEERERLKEQGLNADEIQQPVSMVFTKRLEDGLVGYGIELMSSTRRVSTECVMAIWTKLR